MRPMLIKVSDRFAKVDEMDSVLVGKYKWSLAGTHRDYAKTQVDGKTVYMHRLIMQPPNGMDVDHINHDKLDNRRSNLRVCDRSTNLRNTAARSKTGHKFVAKLNDHYRAKPYHVRHRFAKGEKPKTLGYFATLEEAVAFTKQIGIA